MSPDRTASLSHFAFMPLPNFTMIAFTNAIEVLRMASYLSGANALLIGAIISPDGRPCQKRATVCLSIGVRLCVGTPDIVFVMRRHRRAAGGGDRASVGAAPLRAGRERRAEAACARARMRSRKSGYTRTGYACAIHWENMSALEEEFPDIRFLKESFSSSIAIA